MEFDVTEPMIAAASTFILTTSLFLNRGTAGLGRRDAWQEPEVIHPVLGLWSYLGWWGDA